MQCNTPTSSSSGGGSSGDKGNDDTEETSIKKTVDSAGIVGRYTSIAVDGANVYVSYYDNTNGDLKFAKSIDNGDTW